MSDFSEAFKGVKRVLILAPHMDDEALGCSGTVLLLKQQSVSSAIVFLTNGEKLYSEPDRDIAEKRVQEARRASEMLECEEALFLGYPDGAVADNSSQVSEALSSIIVRLKPEIVLTPSPIDFHPDHRAAAEIALDLLEKHGTFRLAFYEVYTAMRFTHLIDISSVIEQKKQLILIYRTSLYEKPELYLKASLGLNAHRSVFAQKEGFYEALCFVGETSGMQSVLDFMCFKGGT